jgi:glycosyltransferase involved in cell wall biosynthesis
MSMGIPIVCNKGVGDSDLIVNECRAGFVVDELRIADYNRCIDLMLSSPVDSNNIKRGAKKWYALDHAIEQYSDVYNKILTE